MSSTTITPFTRYQRLLLLGLGALLFTIVLDFMLLPALSSFLLDQMDLTTAQFGVVASAYAFAAGISALVTSGIADRFDRKKYLMFFYTGFLIGLVICGLSNSYEVMFAGRVIAGMLGGVVASIAYSIITDSFEEDQRGRAMGILQIAFALSLVAGLPLALVLSSQLNWQMAYGFIFLVGLGFIIWLFFFLQSMTQHLDQPKQDGYWRHVGTTLWNKRHALVFTNNTAIVFGDVLFMTFFSAHCTNNLGLSEDVLPVLYGVGGLITLIAGPLVGKLADRVGQVKVFWLGSLLVILNVALYVWLNTNALWLLIVVHALLFVGITARMVTSVALATLVPSVAKRGSFMSIDASIQQLAAGVAAVLAGVIVVESADGPLENFDILCLCVMGFVLLSSLLMNQIKRMIRPSAN